MGANGVQVETESVQALLAGGIAFDTPMSASPGEPSPEGTVFALYDSYESVTQAGFTTKVPYVVQFDESVRGLSPGAPVEFRGMRVGTVSDVGLQIDVATESVRIPVTIEIEPQRIKFTGIDGAKDNPYRRQPLCADGKAGRARPARAAAVGQPSDRPAAGRSRLPPDGRARQAGPERRVSGDPHGSLGDRCPDHVGERRADRAGGVAAGRAGPGSAHHGAGRQPAGDVAADGADPRGAQQ